MRHLLSFNDADIEKAVAGAMGRNSVMPDRLACVQIVFISIKDVYQQFSERFVAEVKN